MAGSKPARENEPMLTPAQRHFQKVMAERRGISDERDAETRTAHEQILFRLHMHKSSLSQISPARRRLL